jgi:hypothetical protein
VKDKNRFGGGNPRGGYTPMSEDEQEVVSRLVAARDLDVHIIGWGVIREPLATFGDLRVTIPLQITFNRPAIPVPVHYFDLELRTGSGILLFKERQSTEYDQKPLAVGAGTSLSMVWHIAIRAMDPKLVKELKPGAIGLTSRWIDRDTGDFTHLGNTKMKSDDKEALRIVRTGEAIARRDTAQKAARATKNNGE